ncbi:MAG TPA: polysaccharide deacetylase family protein [Bacteroidia bacterium]|nr:polysaccharide deacetylase family protein [Bacteroidia bacterium]
MLLVYTHKPSARFTYIADFILKNLCGFEISYTTNQEEFKVYTGAKLSYSETPIQAEINITPHTLLFEKGIKQQNISISSWNSIPIIFKNTNAQIPFDIFAASFFLISRYEEYLPHITDNHNRFEADNSLAFQNNFLHLPVINMWAAELKKIVLTKYPDLKHAENTYSYISTIDIDNAWAFKNKGLMRTTGAFIKAIGKQNFKDIRERLLTLLGKQHDPYDTYEYILSVQKKYNLNMIYFFLLGNYGVNDKNISANNPKFQSLIKHLGDYAETGIHPSFGSNENVNQVRIEVSRLNAITHRNTTKSRQHFLKLHLPETYKNIISCGIQEDYTMGFASKAGFRASVCSPFKWFDLDADEETSLTVYPFCVMDGTLKTYMNLNQEQAINKCAELISQIKKVNGTCITLWHNETLSNWREWQDWRYVYEEVVKLAAN